MSNANTVVIRRYPDGCFFAGTRNGGEARWVAEYPDAETYTSRRAALKALSAAKPSRDVMIYEAYGTADEFGSSAYFEGAR